MIIDSSALVAILRAEPGHDRFVRAIADATRRLIAAPTLLETSMVLAGGWQDEILEPFDAFLRTASIETIAFTADHAAVARHAFLRYGKGRHPAALNFGDCIAYATARLEAMPLLFKGDDFRLTDIEPAI
ncbi:MULTISPECIES: type II toxin-antitoxin system VapC family toxin [unclassified Mesorhizobium]|uniref:type II toxin-antitoxin system VapC family toxin n=1 Tax=unclassified Mesorhizobium TaxID=325217 RepID=UPI00112A0953|nr:MULTISPECIES: type II toxin-antitoxin system VapC family toxin [unclassified Mesorhizobium]TPL02363.1 type II toxin-antitoxin system VapC family toxin [Mesorhizobium sp. B2-4-16]TPL78162.1 type II toxin-antitoxin system VapC family toxin [Mesorhizobium sp. B2-4-3]